MRIYLLRHGRAEDGFAMRDEERRLTDEGWQKLREAAPTWRRLIEELAVIFVSPLRRAQETATVLAEIVPVEPELRLHEALVPGGPPEQALELIRCELAAGTSSVAFVGHEPHLGCLLALLVTGNARSTIPFKKGMLVAVDLTSATSMIGELRFSLTQRAAAELA